MLPDEPAGHQATGHQQCPRAKREQRCSTTTTGLRKLLRRRRRSRGRCGLGRRRRRSLRRLGLTRSLGNNPTSLGDYVAVLTLGLGGGATSLGLLGLGVSYDRWVVLGESGDLDQTFEVTGSGDNSNQCVGIQGVGNTGNSQNVLDVIQYGSTADDFEFEEVGSSIDVSPTSTTTCDQQVNQAASASG